MDGATVTKYLTKLGLNAETVTVYLELTKLGYSSALQIAKVTKVSRTQVYRHLDSLQEVGLISPEQLNYGTMYRALPLENIEGLLANREAETAAFRRNLSSLAAGVRALAGSGGPQAVVRHFYGVAGLKQANWNIVAKAEKEFKVFEAAHISFHHDRAFARRYRERSIERGLTSYDLTNDTVVNAKDIEPYEPSRTFLRHIDPEVLTINFEMCLYNNVVLLLEYQKDKEMAIEIEHPSLGGMMNQLFDAMWAQATPLAVARAKTS